MIITLWDVFKSVCSIFFYLALLIRSIVLVWWWEPTKKNDTEGLTTIYLFGLPTLKKLTIFDVVSHGLCVLDVWFFESLIFKKE